MIQPLCLYRNILVGVDLSAEARLVLNKSVTIARAFGAQLSIAHVIEPIALAYGGDMPLDLAEIQQQQVHKAMQYLQVLAQNSDMPVQQEHILIGQPADELHYLAQQQGVDLIIVGSHGRKGFALLLGSTPNSLLHGATCDVLTVFVNTKTD